MRILFLGQNPSTKSPDKAFLSTRSGDLLLRLISLTRISIEDVKFANVIEKATPNNKAPKKSEFVKRGKDESFGRFLLDFDIVYVCGELAKVAVHWAREYYWLGKIKFVYLPHPSPRNRQWNDPELFTEVAKMIGDAYESKDVENRKGTEKGRDTSHDRVRRDDVSGKAMPICPVVKDFERRKKEDDHRGSAGMGGADLGQGG